MAIFSWCLANWQGVIGVVAALLAVGVKVSQMAHKKDTADRLQSVEDELLKLGKQ